MITTEGTWDFILPGSSQKPCRIASELSTWGKEEGKFYPLDIVLHRWKFSSLDFILYSQAARVRMPDGFPKDSMLWGEIKTEGNWLLQSCLQLKLDQEAVSWAKDMMNYVPFFFLKFSSNLVLHFGYCSRCLINLFLSFNHKPSRQKVTSGNIMSAPLYRWCYWGIRRLKNSSKFHSKLVLQLGLEPRTLGYLHWCLETFNLLESRR